MHLDYVICKIEWLGVEISCTNNSSPTLLYNYIFVVFMTVLTIISTL